MCARAEIGKAERLPIAQALSIQGQQTAEGRIFRPFAAVAYFMILALMTCKLIVKVKSGRKYLCFDSIDSALNAINRNPFYYIDVRLVDTTSLLYPGESNPLERLENPEFE